MRALHIENGDWFDAEEDNTAEDEQAQANVVDNVDEILSATQQPQRPSPLRR